jgi:hypothetical protein
LPPSLDGPGPPCDWAAVADTVSVVVVRDGPGPPELCVTEVAVVEVASEPEDLRPRPRDRDGTDRPVDGADSRVTDGEVSRDGATVTAARRTDCST